MQAGKLRHRVNIQEPTEVVGAIGGITHTYETVAQRWASVEPLTGRELWQAQSMNTRTTTRIRLRYYADLTPQHRIVHGDVTYELLSVVSPEERKRETVCDAVRSE